MRHSSGPEKVEARNNPRPTRPLPTAQGSDALSPRPPPTTALGRAYERLMARLREVDGAHKEAGDGAVVRSRVLVKDAVDGALVDVVVERLLTALCPPPHPGRALFSFGCCGRLSASSPHAQSGGSGRRRCAACVAAFVNG